MPSSYKGAEPICISVVTGESQQLTVLDAEVNLTGNEWQEHPIVTGPEAPCILGVDDLSRRCSRTQKVQKSNGEWRLTVDYRGLDEVTPPLSAAVPDMLELQYELESKAGKWYATTDITNAFFSIPLAAECRPQFAFTWRGVQYTWNRLPQGWKESPTISQGLIQMALEQGESLEHLQYIDDIIVWGNTAEEVFEKKGEDELSQFAEVKAIQLALDIAEREKWMVLYLYTDTWMVANALWGWLQQWKQSNWQHRGKPIWAAALWQDIAARVENPVVKVCHVDAHVPKSQATGEHQNNQQVDQAAKIEVA
ncbi:hypothetical protein QYF61_026798 [Mycteria americana]|uniref:RNase H type-1 domain-containing protein n=1 Tax=Mycteria americana TaxID=33587 RepID=A0AAN7PLV3_MYCAM|nr:hypothetical protein QYF61_026798 [Mycteria americana]